MLHLVTLQYIVLNCISPIGEMQFNTMSCTPMQSIFPCYITLLCVALYYITHPSMLHYASLHYIALNCISPMSCNPMQLILPCYITLLYINLYQITFLQWVLQPLLSYNSMQPILPCWFTFVPLHCISVYNMTSMKCEENLLLLPNVLRKRGVYKSWKGQNQKHS